MSIPVSCKLCGGNVELECWENTDLQVEQWMGHIQCMRCKTSISMTRPYSSTRDEAKEAVITHWNRLHTLYEVITSNLEPRI